jgi:hypothetical protein
MARASSPALSSAAADESDRMRCGKYKNRPDGYSLGIHALNAAIGFTWKAPVVPVSHLNRRFPSRF